MIRSDLRERRGCLGGERHFSTRLIALKLRSEAATKRNDTALATGSIRETLAMWSESDLARTEEYDFMTTSAISRCPSGREAAFSTRAYRPARSFGKVTARACTSCVHEVVPGRVECAAMGMDLVSESGAEFRATGSGWTYYLNLAEEYGWKPAGTKRPRRTSIFRKWSGHYDSNEGQRVSKRDASAMALALETALADPNRATRGTAVAERLTAAVRAATGDGSYTMRVDGDDSAYLRSMIEFLRCGGFEIT
jgi:hypothetical protein